MDTTPHPSAQPPSTQLEAEFRLDQEAADIARARASIAAGRVVYGAEVHAWIDIIGTDHESPVPYSGR